jgi:hypothetical protein
MCYLRIFLILLFFMLFASHSVLAEGLKPFTSDGCSSFPDGTWEQNTLWLKCCKAHDFAYWKGGTYEERVKADVALQQCVADVGEKEVAALMLSGVRVGGTPFLPTTFRWGYGWPYPRFYGPLSDKEKEEVKEMSNLITQ